MRAVGSLLVVTGPPGAGKSTTARLLADRARRSVLVEGDAFFGFLAAGVISPWTPAAAEQNETVTKAAARAAGEFVRGGYTTVYEGVLGPWYLPTFAAATGLDRLDYVVLMPSADTCVQRVRSRAGHAFSDEPATRKMHAEFAAATVDPRHVVIDPPNDPGLVVQLVRAGGFTYDVTG
jgi:cytidylate kinase